MIICPLNSAECSKFIIPKTRTAFVMTPSVKNQTEELKPIKKEILNALDNLKFEIVEGANLVRQGDYFCSICHEIKSCSFGVSMISSDISLDTVGNVFLESGLMQGFGKPVVFIVDKRNNLPSDLVRTFCINYKNRKYLGKFKELVKNIESFPSTYYIHLADSALEVKDYEKAMWYYKESYLISGNNDFLTKLENIVQELRDDDNIPSGYKRRLIDSTRAFYALSST